MNASATVSRTETPRNTRRKPTGITHRWMMDNLPAVVAQCNEANRARQAVTPCPRCGYMLDMHQNGECPGEWHGEVAA